MGKSKKSTTTTNQTVNTNQNSLENSYGLTNSSNMSNSTSNTANNSSSLSGTAYNAFSQPYITNALGAAQNSYDATQAAAQTASGVLQGGLGSVISNAFNNTGLQTATAYNNDVLNGKYLTGNPYLDQLVANSNADVTNSVNGSIGTRGLTGGSAQAQILSRELAKNDTSLRAAEYDKERANQQAAVGNAATLDTANNSNLTALQSYLTTLASAPSAGTSDYISAIQGLLGNQTNTSNQTSSNSSTSTSDLQQAINQVIGQQSSNSSGVAATNGTSTTKQSGSLFDDLLSLISAGTGVAKAVSSDRRLKRGILKIGKASDGLGVYSYRYVGDDRPQVGVMADEIEKLRPWARGADVGGYATVNYGAL